MTNSKYMPPNFEEETEERRGKIWAIQGEIANHYKKFAKEQNYPGYAFGIVETDSLLLEGYEGYLKLDSQKVKVAKNSVFRVASMSKSFTAMAIIMLRDAGKLALDTPLERFFPGINNQLLTHDSAEPTVRHLLIHAAGFPQDDPWGDRKLAASDDELLQMLAEGVHFSNPTGPYFEYSNLGYSMLGHIIKQVSGESCQQFVQKHIWQPLHMQGAYWDYRDVPANDLALGYSFVDNAFVEQEMLADGAFGPMGGMLSTVEAFATYASYHLQAWPARNDPEHGPLKRSSLREMHHPWNSAQLAYGSYGYGLRWLRDPENRTIVQHSGGLPGFGSNWAMLPDYGIAAIFLTNRTFSGCDVANHGALDLIVERAALKPRQLPTPVLLKMRQKQLMHCLPDWQQGVNQDVFAANFFLDNPIETLRRNTQAVFASLGEVKKVTDIVPENQLRGSFRIIAKNGTIAVKFTLAPERPALIQFVQITPLPRAT